MGLLYLPVRSWINLGESQLDIQSEALDILNNLFKNKILLKILNKSPKQSAE